MSLAPLGLSLDKPLPQNPEAERSVLGSILIDSTSYYRIVSIVNAGASSVTVNAFIRLQDGVTRRIIPKDQIIDTGDMVQVTAPHSIPAGGSLVLSSSTSGVVEYTFSGIKVPSIPTPTDRAQ